MQDLQEIQSAAIANKKEFRDLVDRARAILEGKKITMNDEHFNGQPYGHSKKSLKGKSFTYTKDIFLYISDDGELYIQPPDCNATILLDHCSIKDSE